MRNSKHVLPSKIKIGGSVYTIKCEPIIVEDSSELFGQIKYNDHIIRISEKYPDNFSNTLLHECIHGILNDRGQEHTEELVVQLTNGLLALFRENPELVRYFVPPKKFL